MFICQDCQKMMNREHSRCIECQLEYLKVNAKSYTKRYNGLVTKLRRNRSLLKDNYYPFLERAEFKDKKKWWQFWK